MMDVGILGDAVELAEDAATLQGEIEPLTFLEWLDRSLGLFTMILDYIMDTPPLRFFAAFGVFWVVAMLCLCFLRLGRTLAR